MRKGGSGGVQWFDLLPDHNTNDQREHGEQQHHRQQL